MNWWLNQIGRVPLLTPLQEIELGNRVQAWLNHPDGPDQCPAAIKRSGLRARDHFIRANLRLPMAFVGKASRRYGSAVYDDLVQAANEGLIRAVEKFDPTRGYKFSTYAFWWIRQAVERWMELNGRVVAIPALHVKHLSRIDAVTTKLRQQLGRSPSPEDVAAAMNISPAVLERVLINALPVASLDAMISHEDHRDLSSVLGCEDIAPAEPELDLEGEQLRAMISRLPQRDQEIISLAWGLDGEQMPRTELAAAYGMSIRGLERHLSGLYQWLHHAAQPVASRAPLPPIVTAQTKWPRKRRSGDSGQLNLFCLEGLAPIENDETPDLVATA
jgi:RNA polymerase primary sigma factor